MMARRLPAVPGELTLDELRDELRKAELVINTAVRRLESIGLKVDGVDIMSTGIVAGPTFGYVRLNVRI